MVKNLTNAASCQCRRLKRHRFDPWVGKILWRRKWQPIPVFSPGKSHGQRSLGLQSVGVTKSWARLNDFHSLHTLFTQLPVDSLSDDSQGSSYTCVLRHRARISPGGSQSVVPVAAVLAFPGREPFRDAGSGVPSHTH